MPRTSSRPAPTRPARPPEGSNGDLRGRQNRVRLLQEIRRAGPISRRGLHEATGVRPNTVGEIVGDLLAEGLLCEVGAVVGRRGRRRRLIDLAPDGTVLGAEIFEGAIRVGSLDLRGRLLAFDERPLRSHRPRTVIQTLARSLMPLAEQGRLQGAGVALAGVVDSERGVSRRMAHFPDWTDVPLAAELGKELGVPVRLGNLTEVRLVALKHGALIGPGMTAALVVLEPGAIGCGIVAEGQILRGAVEASSELGQTRIFRDGRRMCLEDLTDWKRLRVEVKRRGGEPPASPRALLESTDRHSTAVRDELIDHLGVALANLVLLIKPSHLWLTGTLVAVGPRFTEPLAAAIRENLLPAFDEALTIEPLDQGPEAGVVGAGGLVLDRLFAQPEIRYF